MNIEKLLDRLETIKDTLNDCDGNQWIVEGIADDVGILMDDINCFGVEDDFGKV